VKAKPGWRARWRERRERRLQTRAWRRERRKGSPDAGNASIRAESGNYTRKD
jgi:hypothetical protein